VGARALARLKIWFTLSGTQIGMITRKQQPLSRKESHETDQANKFDTRP